MRFVIPVTIVVMQATPIAYAMSRIGQPETSSLITKTSQISEKTEPPSIILHVVKTLAPTPSPKPQEGVILNKTVVSTSSDHFELLTEAGIAKSDQKYADYIIMREGSYRYNAEEPKTHAYGACQALPGSKMAIAGDDWRTNVITQLKWCNIYAMQRYHSWYKAYLFKIANGWW